MNDVQSKTSVSAFASEGSAEAKQSSRQKVFFPNLDGLRFFCFLSVFLFHSFATDYESVKTTSLYSVIKNFIAANGNLGVNFFFVLSGFLITYLLIVEKESFGKINIGAFYVRRILRIWPLFYFCVFFGFVVFPQMKILFGQIPNEPARWPYYVLFLNNFDFISHFPDSSELSILWSVAIEEQFYLVWPLLLAILPTKYYWYLFGLLISGSFVFRWFNAESAIVLEHHTLSCISDMTVGGVAAMSVYFRPRFKLLIMGMGKWTLVLLYLTIIGLFLFRHQIFDGSSFLRAADRLVISLLFALVILEQNYAEHSLFKMSRFKLFSKLGTYTYGLYCLHMIGILMVAIVLRKLGLNNNVYEVIFLEGTLSLFVTIALAWLSYKYFESGFLRFKSRFSRISKN